MRHKIKEGDYAVFGAAIVGEGIIFTFEAEKEDDCRILFYGRDQKVKDAVAVPQEFVKGGVRSVLVEGKTAGRLRYNYEINGEVFTDPYASRIIGRERWNDRKKRREIPGSAAELPRQDLTGETMRRRKVPVTGW